MNGTPKYEVQAKRKGANERWTAWAKTATHEEAEEHAAKAEAAGYLARILEIKRRRRK